MIDASGCCGTEGRCRKNAGKENLKALTQGILKVLFQQDQYFVTHLDAFERAERLDACVNQNPAWM